MEKYIFKKFFYYFIIKFQVELENTTQKLMQQENYIKNLKNKMRKHASEKGCNDMQVEDDESFNMIENFPMISEEKFRKKDL